MDFVFDGFDLFFPFFFFCFWQAQFFWLPDRAETQNRVGVVPRLAASLSLSPLSVHSILVFHLRAPGASRSASSTFRETILPLGIRRNPYSRALHFPSFGRIFSWQVVVGIVDRLFLSFFLSFFFEYTVVDARTATLETRNLTLERRIHSYYKGWGRIQDDTVLTLLDRLQ
jgi:hypothetical protein